MSQAIRAATTEATLQLARYLPQGYNTISVLRLHQMMSSPKDRGRAGRLDWNGNVLWNRRFAPGSTRWWSVR
ncbi:MAG: hypothetical protein R3C12_20540 [Planctomycetaceae bacterium]